MRLTQIRDFSPLSSAAHPRCGAPARCLAAHRHQERAQPRGRVACAAAGTQRKGIVPTASGRAFFARARVAHSELRKAEEEAAQIGGPEGGSVAFGVGNITATLIVPEAVARFRRQFPRASIRIVEGLATGCSLRCVTIARLCDGHAARQALDAALRFRPLYRSELVVAARKGHPLRHARSLTQLASCEWLSTSTLTLPGGPIERLFVSRGLPPPRPVIVCEYYITVVALLAKSDMVGLMQRRALKQGQARESLVELDLAEAIPAVTAGIYTRAGTPLTRAASGHGQSRIAVARELPI